MSLLSDLGARIGAQLKNKLDKTAKATDSYKLDGLDSTQFLRSDTSSTFTGNLTISGSVTSAGKPVMTGTKTISTSTPSGGSHGDVWYQV